MQPSQPLYIGLMSGTSLDGVDGVLAPFSVDDDKPGATLAAVHIDFSADLRTSLMELQTAGANETHRESLAANALAHCYAECVATLLKKTALDASAIRAIGAHGQTIRHRPESGYTRQTGNPALLAELTGIDVIADFRSRDLAAGGQGAPLVPAFHQAVFGSPSEARVVANIGGISNISVLNAENGKVDCLTGFDTGPGNMLMDAWIQRHRQLPYDDEGAWAAYGQIDPELLRTFREEPFFALPPPKSTGRDLFDMRWLQRKIAAFPEVSAVDVQATLAVLTATTLAAAIAQYAPSAHTVFVCGGGAYNRHLLQQLQNALTASGHRAQVSTTAALGVPPDQVEALAFAWLAHRHIVRRPGNLPAVTGAAGARILGACYPA